MGARAQHSHSYRRLCQLLRKWRTESGLTQRGLASQLKKPPSYVHKTEVGDRRIDPVEMIGWCRACEIDPKDAIVELSRQI